jgi:hypothetical protein
MRIWNINVRQPYKAYDIFFAKYLLLCIFFCNFEGTDAVYNRPTSKLHSSNAGHK